MTRLTNIGVAEMSDAEEEEEDELHEGRNWGAWRGKNGTKRFATSGRKRLEKDERRLGSVSTWTRDEMSNNNWR